MGIGTDGSYACRKQRSTHTATKRLQTFLRQVTANATRQAWFLQLDIRGFFISIDRHSLLNRLRQSKREPAILWLLDRILFTEPVDYGVKIRAPTSLLFPRIVPE